MSPRPAAYRADLEGLRGVAIVLVVLFHAGVATLAGGFVGVDVFYVLSGFFITGGLVREYEDAGTIDVPAFYGRRALRVLPLLFVVLLATIALVSWLYAPIDRADVMRSARAVALWAGNIAFAQGSVDYFSTRDNPLLHTWSLGVEQQFYLVWAPLVLATALLAERWRTVRGLLLGFAVVGALSLGASMWLTTTAQSWAFFGLPTRLWEFALGGVLALAVPREDGAKPLATILQLAGLAAIAFGVLTYDRGTPYPGFAALLPALGAAALVAGGAVAPDGVVTRALSIMPLQWLGRMSYGWYLWHWPLVGLGAVLAPRIGVPGRLAWSAAALALAWLTYHSVERSARDGRLAHAWSGNRTTRLGLALASSIAVALVAQLALVAAERRAGTPAQRAFAAAREDRLDHGCWASSAKEPLGACAFGDPSSPTRVVLFGDSHAEHWLGAMDRVGKARGWRIELLVMGGCPVAPLGEAPGRKPVRSRACTNWNASTVKRIVAMKPAFAILSSWDHYVPVDGDPGPWQVSADAWQRGLRATYRQLAAAKIPIVAIRGTPRTWFDVPACLSRREAGVPFTGDCTYPRDDALSRIARDAQTAAAKGLPVRFVDMNDQICDAARCPPVKNGAIVFTDDNHLTASFSRTLAPVLSQRIDEAIYAFGRNREITANHGESHRIGSDLPSIRSDSPSFAVILR